MSRVTSIKDLGVIDSIPKALLAVSLGREIKRLNEGVSSTGSEVGEENTLFDRSLQEVEVVQEAPIKGILWWGVDRGYLDYTSPDGASLHGYLYEDFEREMNECVRILDAIDWSKSFNTPGFMVSDEEGDLHVDLKSLVGSWVGPNLKDLYPSWVTLEFLAMFLVMEGSENTELTIDVSRSIFEGSRDALILVKKFEMWSQTTNLRFHLKHPSSLRMYESADFEGGSVQKSKMMEKELAMIHAENTFYHDIAMVGKSQEEFPWSPGDVLCLYDFNNPDALPWMVVVRMVGRMGVNFTLYNIRTAGTGYANLSRIDPQGHQYFQGLKQMRKEERGIFVNYTDMSVGHVMTQYESCLLSPISNNDLAPVRLSDREMDKVIQKGLLPEGNYDSFQVETDWEPLRGFEVWVTERMAVRILLELVDADYNEESLTTTISYFGG